MGWFARWSYKGRHRGVYTPPVLEPRVRLWDKDYEPIHLGSVLWDAKWYGMVSDSEEPGMMTATFEVAPEGGLCSIPLPDLPYQWEPHVYSHGPSGFTVKVLPVVPEGEPQQYGEDWYGPMDFGVPPGLAECGPYHYKEWFHDENP